MSDALQYLKKRQEAVGFNRLMGLELTWVGEGGSTVTMPASENLLNPMGRVHGGALFSLCDVAAGTAAASRGLVAVTLDAAVQYLRSAPGDRELIARATEIKTGKTISVFQVDVSDSEDKQYVNATFTMFYTEMKTEELR